MRIVRPTLSPNMAVSGQPRGLAEGLLGPIVLDPENSRFWALTSAQLAPDSDHSVATFYANRQLKLSYGPPRVSLDGDPVQDCSALVVGIPLAYAPIALDGGQTTPRGRAPQVVSRPEIWRGAEVRLLTKGGGERRVRLVSTDSHFSMPNPASQAATIFDNALEVHSIDGDPIIARGDAGALLVDIDGNWLGVVVAGRDEIAFAAPLHPIVDRHQLKIVSPSEIREWNRVGVAGLNAVTADEAEREVSAEDEAIIDASADRPAILEAREWLDECLA